MIYPLGVILIITISLQSMKVCAIGGGISQVLSKSGVRAREFDSNKDIQYVTCEEPNYRCCRGSSPLMSAIKSPKCRRDDGFPGICCATVDVTLVEITFVNGTKSTSYVNERPTDVKKRLDAAAGSDNFFLCPQEYECCRGAPGIMSAIISEKCVREDGFAGICCATRDVTDVEVVFANGTIAKTTVNESPTVFKQKLDSIADQIERNREEM